jgi:hypothetical protein
MWRRFDGLEQAGFAVAIRNLHGTGRVLAVWIGFASIW